MQGRWSCKEGEPDTIQGQATVKDCRFWCTMNMKCFHNASVGQVNWVQLPGRLPLHLVSRLLGVHSNVVAIIIIITY